MSGGQACRWEEGTQCGRHDHPLDGRKGPGCSLFHASVHRREVAARRSVVHRLDIAGGSRRKEGSPAMVVPEPNSSLWRSHPTSLKPTTWHRHRSDSCILLHIRHAGQVPRHASAQGVHGQMPAGHANWIYIYIYMDSYASTRVLSEVSSPKHNNTVFQSQLRLLAVKHFSLESGEAHLPSWPPGRPATSQLQFSIIF